MGQIATTLERGAHLVGAYLESRARGQGITQAEAHVLAQLARRGPMRIATLHHEFGHKRSTLTNVVDRLERRGLISRQIDRADRRSFVLEMTPAGRETASVLVAELDALERRLSERVNDDQIAAVEAVVAVLADLAGSPD